MSMSEGLFDVCCLREVCTIACYLLLVHAHFGQSGPDSLGLPDHDRELRVDSMVSHDAGQSIEVVVRM